MSEAGTAAKIPGLPPYQGHLADAGCQERMQLARTLLSSTRQGIRHERAGQLLSESKSDPQGAEIPWFGARCKKEGVRGAENMNQGTDHCEASNKNMEASQCCPSHQGIRLRI